MQIATKPLPNTSLSVPVEDLMSRPFKSSVDVPQGESFSLVVFTTTFEMVIQQTQSQFPTTTSADVRLHRSPSGDAISQRY